MFLATHQFGKSLRYCVGKSFLSFISWLRVVEVLSLDEEDNQHLGNMPFTAISSLLICVI